VYLVATQQNKNIPQQKLFFLVLLFFFVVFLLFGNTIVGQFLGLDRLFGNDDTTVDSREIILPSNRRGTLDTSQESTFLSGDSGSGSIFAATQGAGGVGDDRYSSGKDCTAAGGATAHTETGSRACQTAKKKACDAAKAKVIADGKDVACQRACEAQDPPKDGKLICTCPEKGTNPNTDQPYTCYTKNGAQCTANTVARCTCACVERTKEPL